MGTASKALLLASTLYLAACDGDGGAMTSTVEEGPTTVHVPPDVGVKHYQLSTVREDLKATLIRVRLERSIDAPKLDALAKDYVEQAGMRTPEVQVHFFVGKLPGPNDPPWAISTVGKTVTTRILGPAPG